MTEWKDFSALVEMTDVDMFTWNKLKRPIVGLSPMADFTDTPFCLISKKLGAPLVYREMVSADALVRLNEKTLGMAKFHKNERPVIQQIFGSDPDRMAEAARIIEERFKPDGIDINMGCPAHKIVKGFHGASLMKNSDLAANIIRSVKNAVSIPVSVKTRLGWKDDRDILEFVKVLEDAGADLIAIHGRTKEQAYSGVANWDRVGEARKNVKVPVLVNGDIVSVETAKDALARSNADGMLIARGALGNPWIFQRILSGLETGKDPGAPTMEERLNVIREHARLQVKHHGEKGLVQLRKHFPWYFKGIKGTRALRADLVQVSTLEDLEEVLNKI
ncbi:MAG: tRNA dihydrouridine synthase DusB [Patescibacteria group bacterium]